MLSALLLPTSLEGRIGVAESLGVEDGTPPWLRVGLLTQLRSHIDLDNDTLLFKQMGVALPLKGVPRSPHGAID